MIGDSTNKQKVNGYFLSTNLATKCGLVFVLTYESACLQRFHFKAIKKNLGFSKIDAGYFLNSPQFKRLVHFYIFNTVTMFSGKQKP